MDDSLMPPLQYDVDYRISRLPEWKARLYRYLSVGLWGGLPSGLQKKISAWYASNYNKPFSRRLIKPYIQINYRDKNYLSRFKPPFGKSRFETFQDFFIREFQDLPRTSSERVWPCEGLLCEMGNLSELHTARVKNDIRYIPTIFGLPKNSIPPHYTFCNIFLHNKNYHRIHAPVTGEITRIQHIPGDLLLLRPWIYRQDPSLPAFRNERYNIDMTDDAGKKWHLSVVGGPAVGSIELSANVVVGNRIGKLEELAVFYLGSTCCIAAPYPPARHRVNCFVEVGVNY